MVVGPILIVEDDDDIRLLLRGLLEHRGYEVLCAQSGQEALDMLATAVAVPPSLILLDVMMPIMDGYAFRAAQRSIPALADVPVVVMSAVSDVRLGELAPAAVVVKPLEFDDLLPILERVCRASASKDG
jgi:CheY-like chemotaxis protein